jgi:transposase
VRRSRPPHPPEFRAEAIRLVKTSGDPLRQIAEDLGVSDQTLRNWDRQDDVDASRRSGLTSDERARLREFENKNRKLREEREILRKARPAPPFVNTRVGLGGEHAQDTRTPSPRARPCARRA